MICGTGFIKFSKIQGTKSARTLHVFWTGVQWKQLSVRVPTWDDQTWTWRLAISWTPKQMQAHLAMNHHTHLMGPLPCWATYQDLTLLAPKHHASGIGRVQVLGLQIMHARHFTTRMHFAVATMHANVTSDAIPAQLKLRCAAGKENNNHTEHKSETRQEPCIEFLAQSAAGPPQIQNSRGAV